MAINFSITIELDTAAVSPARKAKILRRIAQAMEYENITVTTDNEYSVGTPNVMFTVSA